MHKLVLLRHGESTWNKENRFTGWTDVDLSERGRAEAQEAGRLLREGGFVFDEAYTSVLKRAICTLGIALEVLDQLWIPVTKTLAAQRAPLRRAARAEQSRDPGQARGGPNQDLASELRHSPATIATRRRTPAVARSTLRRALSGGTAGHRVAQGYRRALPALLARDDRAGDPVGQARAHRRARQQPPRAWSSISTTSPTPTSSSATSRPASRSSTNWTTISSRSAATTSGMRRRPKPRRRVLRIRRRPADKPSPLPVNGFWNVRASSHVEKGRHARSGQPSEPIRFWDSRF